MKNKGMILLSTILFASSAFADLGTYKLDVTRDGVKHLQVALNTWQGEYPGPVIDVNSKKPTGTTKVEGWESLRELTVRKSCTIQNGLYHPWSQTENSVINYYTIAPAVDYEVIQNVSTLMSNAFWTMDDASPVAFQKGDELINIVYLGEGTSMATHVSGETQRYVGFTMDGLEQPLYFKKTLETKALKTIDYGDGEVYPANEQWLYLTCEEGYNVFIEDLDILKQKGILEGNITGYGEIEGAK